MTNEPTASQASSKHAPLAAVAHMVEQRLAFEARATYDPEQGLREIMRPVDLLAICDSPDCGGHCDMDGYCDDCGRQVAGLTSASVSVSVSRSISASGVQVWQEVGVELRRLPIGQEMSLPELGRQVHYSPGYQSKIETGARRITPEVARVVDDALKTGGVLAALLPTPQSPPPVDDEPESTGTDACPYPGLAAFGPEEARWFFGRDQATSDLIGKLDARLAGGGPLAVVAPSGAGKSSLLAAGLIPALASGALPGSRAWPVLVTTPGAHPLLTLATQVAERTGADPADAAKATADPERFAAFLTGAIAAPGGKQRETSSSARVVLIVDQFEETFTECQQESERQAFITALCTAAQSAAVLVMLGVRVDFYGHCLAYPALLTAVQSPVVVGPMSADQLRSIITGPAEAEGLQVEPGLVELLLRDLGVTDDPGAKAAGYDPGALPLLAHALRATWQQRSGRLLTVAGYRRTGGIREAIATTAERVYTRLSPPEQQIAQQILLRLVQVSAQTGEVRRRVPRDRLLQALPAPAETTEKVLETFGRARLLTFDIDKDVDSVKITHEALLRAWPRLTDWITADRTGLRIHQLLSEAAEAWEAEDRDPSLVYRGSRLAIAQDWAAGPARKDQLSALEAAYLQASIDQNQREQRAEQRRTRRLSTLVGVLAVSLVLALLAGGIAFQQRRLAIATEFAAASQSVAATHPDAAMLLAVEAYRLAQVPGTRSALLSAQSQYFAGQLAGHTGPINKVVFSPDGRILATASADGTARLWDVASRHPIITLDGPGPINDAQFSPDGRLLVTVTAGATGTARLWDTASHQTIATLPGAPGTTLSAATFSPDGRLLATTGAQGTALWDLASRRLIATLPGLINNVVVFSPDGRTLATTGAEGTVQLWNVTDPSHPTPLGPPLTRRTDYVNVVVFSPDGRTLATTGAEGTVQLWNVTDPSHPTPLGPSLTGQNKVNAVVFSPDGKILATASDDGTARLWDVATRQQVGILRGHNGAILSVTFHPDGHTVATAGDDQIVKLWDTSGPILSPPTIDPDVHRMEFSPDGRILATIGAEGITQLWDMVSRRRIATLSGRINAMAFSEDGRLLATAGTEGTTLWDMVSRRHIVTLPGPTKSTINKVALSPDGRILATTGTGGLATTSPEGTVQLWNVTDSSHPMPLGPPLTGHTSSVNAVAFSRDGRLLATAGKEGTTLLWDIASRHPIATLPGPTGPIFKVVFSPDNHILTMVSDDGTVWRWEAATGRFIATVLITTLLPGERFYPVALSSDGRTLATASSDGTTTKLWDMDHDGQPIATLAGHTGPINTAAFSRDSSFLATASDDGTVRLWDLNTDQVTRRLCEIIGTVSHEQWDRLFIPKHPYQPIC